MHRLLPFLLLITSSLVADDAQVVFVVGPKAPAMDKAAAGQLAQDFQSLFGATTKITDTLPSATTNVVLIGSPQSNPAIAADAWPAKLSPQGHVLKSTKQGLIVGGASPVSTLWAASELSYHFGIRHLLQGDVLPVEKPALKLDGIDAVFEPKVQVRGWSMFNGSLTGAESWSKEEHLKLLRQLVKLKFTHVLLPKRPVMPPAIPVDGDTGGRKAFGGAKSFPADSKVADVREEAAALGLEVSDMALVTHALGAVIPSVLPQFSLPVLDRRVHGVASRGATSIIVSANMPGDLNAAVHLMSRMCFDDKLTADKALDDLVTPICGEGVSERLKKGFDLVAQAAKLIDANDANAGVPDPTLIQRHLDAKGAPPAWLTEVKTLVTGAMSEMYRANTRAREGARSLTLYHAKRLEFATHYFTALEAIYKSHDPATHDESMETAVESFYNALNSLADAARDASDRGAIALLNEHGYRVLTKAASK